MTNQIDPPEYPQAWNPLNERPLVSDEEAGRYVLMDFKAIADAKFSAGEGVVTIGPDTPDEVILLTIKHAVSFGKPFTVLPPMTIVHDDLG